MGGPAAPSIGFGAGIERLLLACDAEGVLPVPPVHLDAFVVDLVGVADTTRLLAELRESGLAADRAYGSRSPKKQFTAADRSGARWAVIIGADETKRGMVAVKDLRSDKPQGEVRREEIAAWLLTRKDEAQS
jgi:histidyl-tRNA synthetase